MRTVIDMPCRSVLAKALATRLVTGKSPVRLGYSVVSLLVLACGLTAIFLWLLLTGIGAGEPT